MDSFRSCTRTCWKGQRSFKQQKEALSCWRFRNFPPVDPLEVYLSLTTNVIGSGLEKSAGGLTFLSLSVSTSQRIYLARLRSIRARQFQAQLLPRRATFRGCLKLRAPCISRGRKGPRRTADSLLNQREDPAARWPRRYRRPRPARRRRESC